MTFKDSSSDFQIIDIALIEPDPQHPRQNIDEGNLKGLANSIQKMGVIHPLLVRPAKAEGRYTIVVGERRRQAAMLVGETVVPVIVRNCSPDQSREVQVFENMGLGVRSALEPRDMANAIQTISEHFATLEEAAQYFGRAPPWLSQAPAAANLSEKVTALLDSGKISSTGTAVQLEKLAKKNEAKAGDIVRIEETRPLSKQKRWALVEKVAAGQAYIVQLAVRQFAKRIAGDAGVIPCGKLRSGLAGELDKAENRDGAKRRRAGRLIGGHCGYPFKHTSGQHPCFRLRRI